MCVYNVHVQCLVSDVVYIHIYIHMYTNLIGSDTKYT